MPAVAFRTRLLILFSLALAIVWIVSLPDAKAAPPITLTPNVNSAEIAKGASAQFTVTVTGEKYDPPPSGPTLNFNVVSISPSGATASFNPTSLTVASGSTSFSGTTTLTFSTTTSTAPGTYTIIANGKFANDTATIIRTNNITFTVIVGDFAIAVSPNTIEVRQQGSASALVNISSIFSFNGQVQLSWAWNNQAPGVSVSITSPVTVPKQSWTTATLSMDASLTAPTGTYSGFVIGTYAGTPQITHSVQVTVVVKSLPALEVSVSASPDPAVVSKISTIAIRVTSDGAPISSVSLTISSTGGSLGATSGITDSGGQFLTTFNSTAPGTVTISVTASRTGYITRSSTLSLKVAGDFQVSISPSEVTMNLGSTKTFQLMVQSSEGFNSAVTLAVATNLPGVTTLITPAIVTPPPNGIVTATVSVSLDLTATPGAIDLTITATRNPLVKSATLRLNVPVRDFQILLTPPSITLAQGKQAFYNITMTSRGGFSGLVDIRALGIPDDVEFTIVPNALNLESGATRSALLGIKTTELTKAGTFLFLVEATGGATIKRSIQGTLVILPLFIITIDSVPRVSAISVDGVEVPASDLPKQYKWVKGETHTLAMPVQIVEGKPGIRYVFTKWSDGFPSMIRGVVVNDPATYKVELKTQLFLTVKSSITDLPLPSRGAGWFDNGTQAQITTPVRINLTADKRYDFRGWTGNLTDAKSNTTVLMDKSKTVVSNYMLQYFVKGATNPAGLAEVVNANRWHDAEIDIDLTTTKRVGDHSFRFWTLEGRRVTGLPIMVKVDKPLSLVAHYVHLPKVGIVWANTTSSKTEFQGETAYLWFKIENSKDRAGEVRLDVRTTFDGIDVSPKSLVLNFEPGQSHLLGFELKFLREGAGTFEAKINETASGAQDFISVALKVFPKQSKDNMRAVGKAISVEALPRLNQLMVPTPDVKSLAERILVFYNVPQFAEPNDKAKALLKFVNQHYEAGPSANPPSVTRIAAEIEASGGPLSNRKIIGDSRTAQIFLGGLLRSLEIPARPLVGTMEISPTSERVYLVMHSWIEFKVSGDWVFADAAEGVLDLGSMTFPSNMQNLARDSKLYYELSAKFGGPIGVMTYEGKSIDITERYRLGGFSPLEGTVVYTKGDTAIVIRDEAGKDFDRGVNYATVWTPIEPQTTEIRALKPEGQIVLVGPSVPLSKYSIFVTGPKTTGYTFQVMDAASVFPTIDSMTGSLLDRGMNEHRVMIRRDGRLQVEQLERLAYADKPVLVSSNSTVVSVAVSQDVRAVRMTLTGREGSSGILNITVPKNLLIDELRSSPEKVVVLLDGKFASPEIRDLTDRIAISLSYTHSIRNIVAYLKTFQVNFDARDPFGLVIHDAELAMYGPVTNETKESNMPTFKPLIPGTYQYTVRYRGEKQVINQTISDRDVVIRVNLLRSDATIAAFAAGIVVAIAAVALVTQLILSRVFRRKPIS